MALVDTLVGLVIGLLIGGIGIYLGARAIVNSRDYSYAVFTAAIGALALAIVTQLLPSIPFGSLVALLVWLAVIKWRYRAGWIDAALIAMIAWIGLVLTLYVLGALGFPSPPVYGFP